MVSQSEIIQQLNYAARSYGIPMLDIYYPIAARMSAYRTAHHWGLVIELFEFNDSCIGHACPRTRVFCFGDALQQAQVGAASRYTSRGMVPAGRCSTLRGPNRAFLPRLGIWQFVGRSFPSLQSRWTTRRRASSSKILRESTVTNCCGFSCHVTMTCFSRRSQNSLRGSVRPCRSWFGCPSGGIATGIWKCPAIARRSK